MAGPRYSEADRRGRNSTQDVTNIGVAGRRTGLRVEGARRGSDGFENQSAYFSPTTTAKKAKHGISSPRSVRSATRIPSGSLEDMELEASMSAIVASLMTGSAQDVTAALRRRSEGPQIVKRSQLSRRSLSPTKTHLNSPALRVRSAQRSNASPMKSAMKPASRPTTADTTAKIARKLDFRKTDPGAESDDETEEPKRTRQSGSILRKPLSKSPASAKKRRISVEPPELESDEVASPKLSSKPSRTRLLEETVQPDFSPNAANNDVQHDVEYDAPDDDDAPEPAFEEYIQEPEDELPPATTRKTPKKSPKKSPKRTPKLASPETIAEEPANDYEVPMDFDQDLDEASRVMEPEEPPKRKRGRPPKQNKTEKAPRRSRPTAKKELSPSRAASRSRSRGRTASPQREWRESVQHNSDENEDNEEGIRKSSRFKIAPLAFWRGEKMVYGRGSRRKSAGGTIGLTLPEVKEIIHVDIIEGEQVKRKYRGGRRKTPTANGKRPHSSESEQEASDDDDDEENWSDKVIVEAPVRSFEAPSQLVKKVLAVPGNAYNPVAVVGQGIFFQKTLYEEPHFASGVLDIPVGAAKPVKPSKQNTMFFFIFYGYVQIKIHDVVFRLRKGGQFTVPRGNFYEIQNVGKKDARLFFSQSTDTLANHLIAHPEIAA